MNGVNGVEGVQLHDGEVNRRQIMQNLKKQIYYSEKQTG